MSWIAGGLLLSMTGLVHAQEATQPEQTYDLSQSRMKVAEDFMVVAAHPLAVQAGYDVLARGGSAVDAMVTVQLMLNLVEPQSSGIGGGAFTLYWDADKQELSSWDGRERAPLAATPDYWLHADGSKRKWSEALVGGRSVGVPGTLLLLETLHQQYGTLPWGELLAPVVTQAEEGFVISPRLASSIVTAQKRKLDEFETTKKYFFQSDGMPKTAGTLLQNPEFANALRMIAVQGSEVFYRGKIADDILQAVRNVPINPSILTKQDFTQYHVKRRKPVCLDYREYQVCGMGPPSSGALTVGQILGLIEPFDMEAMGESVEGYHHFIEAAKLSYADRATYMADSDYVAVPEKGLLNKTYLFNRQQQIRAEQAMFKAKAGMPPMEMTQHFAPDTQSELHGTSHFVIVDREGNVVSSTTTIETGFGSRVMSNGFLLNNELTDFSFAPEKDGAMVANRVEGGKRPRSSMAPTIVLKDGTPMLAIGSPGGSRIINYVAQSLVAILDWGMMPEQALDLGHVVNRNGTTDLEENTKAVEWQKPLEALGHQVKVRNLNSGLHAVLWKDGKLYGAADKRREGIVMGE